MGEYEPNDSRNVTLNPNGAPGEPPRTGPREGQTRAPGQSRPDQARPGQPTPGQAELEQDERGDDPEANALADQAADAEAEAVLRKRSGEGEPPR